MVCALLTPLLHAGEPSAVDQDLPQPFNGAEAEALLANSPFTRSLNLSDSIHLTGIAYVDGHPVATLHNWETKESYVVSDEPNAQGWKLVDMSSKTELKRTQIKIMMGPEVVTVRFSDEPVKPGPLKKHSADPSAPSKYLVTSSAADGAPPSEADVKAKLDAILAARMAKHPEMTDEEKAAYTARVMAKMQAAASRGSDGGTGKAPKSSKGSKGM